MHATKVPKHHDSCSIEVFKQKIKQSIENDKKLMRLILNEKKGSN